MKFDKEIAKIAGVNAAIIYENIRYWVEKNDCLPNRKIDGKTWMFYSVSEFKEYYEFFTTQQIRTALDILVKKNLIIKSKKGKFGRTGYTVNLVTDNKDIVTDNKNNIVANNNCVVTDNNCIVADNNSIVENNKPLKQIKTDINTIETQISEASKKADASSFNEIAKLFSSGSEQISGVPYYHNGREAKNVKQLEARYRNDQQGFIDLAKKYYAMIAHSGDDFWTQQPFTPSAFNSHYNRIVAYQPPNKVIQLAQIRSEKYDYNESMLERYGTYSDDDLNYLRKHDVINDEALEYIKKNRTMLC